ncbi:LOW QUALITY PROTEIN: U-box domain-containing protein 15-like [Aristolochia californica]|uniref:LOW QUALITY PROTEIN: U-box domain-containing protein 15-like n=1 Tax=Aristolochia californica TaxID=171875 RepID=UPI0035E1CA8B
MEEETGRIAGGEEASVEQIEKGELSETLEEANPRIRELIDVVESVTGLGDFRKTLRKECFNLIRRMKLLLPFLEEIQDLEGHIPVDAVKCLSSLTKVFACAKKLLECCHDGSKIYLVLENEAVMGRFHGIYDRLRQALEGMPYDEMEISDEVKEQIEFMRVQLKKAKKRTDTQDIELAMDIMVIFSKQDDRNADIAILERLAKKLELHSVPDMEAETEAVRKLINQKAGQSSESTEHVIDLLNQFREIVGLEKTDCLEDPAVRKSLQKCPSLQIPSEFLCPISLEIMTDPVIVATGQTYERSSIQMWLESNHRTCPITRQPLAHLSLAPNYALRNLIQQWCEKNNVQLPEKKTTSTSESSSVHEEKISSLVQNLSSSQLEVQRKAVTKIRILSKESPDNRIAIATKGGIPPLIHLLSYPDSKIKEHTVTALLNLSIEEENKKSIAKQGAIPAIIDILQNGTVEARENSAAALFSLSMIDENKVLIGLLNAIPPLVDLLTNGTIRGKKDAATALFNLSLNNANKARAIEAGIVPPLLNVLGDRNLGMVDEALSIFLLLVMHPEGRSAIGKLSFIETLVQFIREGTPKNKECALSVLLELSLSNSSFVLAALQFGVYEHLTEISRTGTNRAQRKANSLLQHMSKCEQV